MKLIDKNYISTWLAEIRANFLILSVVLVMIGAAAAWHEGSFNSVLFLLTVFGVVCAHISVNLFNEYSDWRTGIDENTDRTPFSGGSGMIQKGRLMPSHVKYAAWISLLAAFITGLLLAWVSGWPVLVLMVIGGLTTIFYTDYLAKWMVGELTSGITLGSFVVIGAYFVQTQAITSEIVWASIPPGILTLLLLLLNEFPDSEADRTGGRRHIVILLGKHYAASVYSVFLLAVYLIISAGVMFGDLPAPVLIGLATAPLAAVAAWRAVRYGHDTGKLVPALGMNVIVVLATDFLMALGFIIA